MRKVWRVSRILMMAALVMALMTTGALATSLGAKVLTSSMKVYSTPTTDGTLLGSLDQGTSFSVTAISGNWARVSYRGNVGYASMQSIIFDGRLKAKVTSSTTVSFVTKASYAQNVKYRATLGAGVTVYVVAMYDGYALIENSDASVLGCIKLANLERAK